MINLSKDPKVCCGYFTAEQGTLPGKRARALGSDTSGLNPACLANNYVALSKLPNLLELQGPHLQNGNDQPFPVGLFWKLVKVYFNLPTQCQHKVGASKWWFSVSLHLHRKSSCSLHVALEEGSTPRIFPDCLKELRFAVLGQTSAPLLIIA